jgi:hypothetical protein
VLLADAVPLADLRVRRLAQLSYWPQAPLLSSLFLSVLPRPAACKLEGGLVGCDQLGSGVAAELCTTFE